MSERRLDYLRRMGPSWIISAVACGPATLASVSLAGAAHGFDLLWVVILSAVFGTTAQYLAAKSGVLEGRGIISATQDRLGRAWAWVLTVDAVLATYLAAIFLMNALVGITGLVTGLKSPWWGLVYAGAFTAFLIRGGYKWFETLCKAVVGFVVVCFVITAAKADISLGRMAGGLVPSFPGGLDAAMMMAAIMGGAVHVTIIGMHTYNTNAKGWTKKDLGLARFDTVMSMGVAFGLYSVAIFSVAAAVLYPAGVKIKGAADAALSLGPLLGSTAQGVFLAGLWAAALSTIMPTFLAGAYFISDKMGWPRDTGDRRFRLLIAAGVFLSVLGPFIKGSFFLLLPVMLAVGLCGTPLILAIILYFLNRTEVAGEYKNSWVLNVLGGVTFLVTLALAARFVLGKLGIL